MYRNKGRWGGVYTSERCNDIRTMDKIRIRQATKQGYIECVRGGVADFSYPSSETRRGRVQNMGKVSPTILTDTEICKVESEYRIRKLTPLETWRLMGFSDEDFYKAKAVNPDSKLYKQAGNSIVVNVLEAVFRQMIEVET